MKGISKFFKQYGFYLAISLICIGSLVAVALIPNKGFSGSKNKQDVTGSKVGSLPQILDEDKIENQLEHRSELDSEPIEIIKGETSIDLSEEETKRTDTKDNKESQIKDNRQTQTKDKPLEKKPDTKTKDTVSEGTQNASEIKVSTKSDENKSLGAEVADKKVKTETFESTTVTTSEPFFAEGDSLEWPVQGKVVVPYTDNDTKFWYSKSLNQTMRTFGICIQAEEGTPVKAAAKGTVTDVLDHWNEKDFPEFRNYPLVGTIMVVDIGNGYSIVYGFQKGQANKELVGQIVNAGDVIGKVGEGVSAFKGLGSNIYLQIVHNNKTVNPLNLLVDPKTAPKDEGVDLGFSKGSN